jgi:hypothetical protein
MTREYSAVVSTLIDEDRRTTVLDGLLTDHQEARRMDVGRSSQGQMFGEIAGGRFHRGLHGRCM